MTSSPDPHPLHDPAADELARRLPDVRVFVVDPETGEVRYSPVRCDYSDLPVVACGHCNGKVLDRSDDLTEAYVPAPLGRRVEIDTPIPDGPTYVEVEDTDDPVVKVSRDLREITQLAEHLADQALHRAAHRLMPGGDAMAALATVSSPEAARWRWLARLAAWNDRGRPAGEYPEPDLEAEVPLQLLVEYTERWRDQLAIDPPRTPTLMSEAGFVTDHLVWASEHAEDFRDACRAIRTARVVLERILTAGARDERSHVPCSHCPSRPRLVKAYAASADPNDDRWRCPACAHKYDDDEFMDAFAKHLRSEAARRWVRVADAIAILRGFQRPERTVRGWLDRSDVQTRTTYPDHVREVWWPDLWTLHLKPPRRGRRPRATA